MGKNLLILGAFVSALMLASCVGGKKETVTYTPEEIADAGQVMNCLLYTSGFVRPDMTCREQTFRLSVCYNLFEDSQIPSWSHILSGIELRPTERMQLILYVS